MLGSNTATVRIPNSMVPYLWQLWMPILIYSLIELTFKEGMHVFFKITLFSQTINYSISFLLRTVFAVALLEQLYIRLTNAPIALNQLWQFHFEKTVKVLFSNLLIILAFILPLLLASSLLPQKPTHSIQLGFYAFSLIWTYLLIYFLVCWWFNTYLIVFENCGPVASLQESYLIVKNRWLMSVWQLIQILVHGMVVITLCVLAITMIIGGISMLFAYIKSGHRVDHMKLIGMSAKQLGPILKELLTGFPLQAFVSVMLASHFLWLKQNPFVKPDQEETERTG